METEETAQVDGALLFAQMIKDTFDVERTAEMNDKVSAIISGHPNANIYACFAFLLAQTMQNQTPERRGQILGGIMYLVSHSLGALAVMDPLAAVEPAGNA